MSDSPGMKPIDDELVTNHEEALQLAHMKKDESNLARCYIDLQSQLTTARAAGFADGIEKAANVAERVGALFVPHEGSRRHPEWFEGGVRVSEIIAAQLRNHLKMDEKL